MNIILIGGTAFKRLEQINIAKSILCNKSYVYHSVEKLTNRAWMNSTKALVVCGDTSSSDVYIEEYKLRNGLVIDIYDFEKYVHEFYLGENIDSPSLTRHIGRRYIFGCQEENIEMLEGGKIRNQTAMFHATFDSGLYFRNLKSKIGRNLIHFNTVSSTMDYFNNVNEWNHAVVLADIQSHGKGRKENEWLSPDGSLAMTFGFEFSLELEHPASVQHLVAVCLCKTLRQITSSNQIMVKWPNDIYWGTSIKLGGLLTKSTIMGSNISVCCGIGLNLNNKKPMMGIELLSDATVQREILISYFFNLFEESIHQIKFGEWRQDYYDMWCHQNENVMTDCGNGKITGLDLDGFLLVKMESGDTIRYDTDNNSFDLMLGLISRK